AATSGRTIQILDASVGYKYVHSEAYRREQILGMKDSADAQRQAGRMPEAIALDEQALEQQKAAFAADHADTISSMDDLAGAYQSAGRLPEAIALFEQLVEMTKARPSSGLPDTPGCMHKLARAYQAADRVQETIACYQQIIRHRKDDFLAHNNLAWLL